MLNGYPSPTVRRLCPEAGVDLVSTAADRTCRTTMLATGLTPSIKSFISGLPPLVSRDPTVTPTSDTYLPIHATDGPGQPIPPHHLLHRREPAMDRVVEHPVAPHPLLPRDPNRDPGRPGIPTSGALPQNLFLIGSDTSRPAEPDTRQYNASILSGVTPAHSDAARPDKRRGPGGQKFGDPNRHAEKTTTPPMPPCAPQLPTSSGIPHPHQFAQLRA
ncbi:hypothetical protein Pd630_LPD04318 [Rhodococcus opacus PD630]|nr:hypothetical protein Pd630_LPD04318 [Rhodococcus opacus PD630]